MKKFIFCLDSSMSSLISKNRHAKGQIWLDQVYFENKNIKIWELKGKNVFIIQHPRIISSTKLYKWYM